MGVTKGSYIQCLIFNEWVDHIGSVVDLIGKVVVLENNEALGQGFIGVSPVSISFNHLKDIIKDIVTNKQLDMFFPNADTNYGKKDIASAGTDEFIYISVPHEMIRQLSPVEVVTLLT